MLLDMMVFAGERESSVRVREAAIVRSMGRAHRPAAVTASESRAGRSRTTGQHPATIAIDVGLVDTIAERLRGLRPQIQVSFADTHAPHGRSRGYLEEVFDDGTCRVMLAHGGARRKFPLQALTAIPLRTYRRCGTCGMLSLTNGEDRLDEHHAKDCPGVLQEDGACQARIYHGPGHQSTTRCRKAGPHEIHEAVYGSGSQFAEWRGIEAFSGFFDEAPQTDD